MIPGLPVSSIQQCKWTRREGTCLELFPAIGGFEPTFIEAHQASQMIRKVWSFKSRIKTCSFPEQIISSGNEVFKDFESAIVIEIRKLGNLS
jgi:hypothetical protein